MERISSPHVSLLYTSPIFEHGINPALLSAFLMLVLSVQSRMANARRTCPVDVADRIHGVQTLPMEGGMEDGTFSR